MADDHQNRRPGDSPDGSSEPDRSSEPYAGATPDSGSTPGGLEGEAGLPLVAGPAEVVLHRRFDNLRSILVTEGDFADLIGAWRRHVTLWDSLPDGLSITLVRQGLASAALTLANRPRGETVAWTLNLKRPPTNLFLTGDSRASIVTGRVFTEAVKTVESSRLFVETVRSGDEPSLSILEVVGLDVLYIFEQWFARSVQNPVRFFELEEDRFVQARGMPGVNRSWLESLRREDLPEIMERTTFLEDRVFRFECGCTPRKMLDALHGVYAKDPEELFHGEEQVEVSCPRCGRRWWVTRERFLTG